MVPKQGKKKRYLIIISDFNNNNFQVVILFTGAIQFNLALFLVFHYLLSLHLCFYHHWLPLHSGYLRFFLLPGFINCIIMSWQHLSDVFKMIFLSMNELKECFEEIFEEMFSSIFPPDVNITERQAQALANAVRVNGTSLLKNARSLFLWQNLTNSVLV